MFHLTGKKLAFPAALIGQNIRRRNLKDPGIIFPVVVFLAAIVITLLFFLWSRLETVKLGYDISKENKKTIELINENKNLRLQVVNLKSPERIERLARKRLGLVYPGEGQIVVIR
jgi:cell division protein FtsL